MLSDDLLAQGTCAILIDGEIVATAWLVSQGYVLTAGHVLCLDSGQTYENVQIQFTDDDIREAQPVQCRFQQDKGIDFALLKLIEGPYDRQPLPIALNRSVAGTFRLRGYGQTLGDPTTSWGQFVGIVDRKNSARYRLFRLRCQELVDEGFSGGPIYSDQLQAVVAIQIEGGKSRIGPTSQTVLAIPLYRVAGWSFEVKQLFEQQNKAQADQNSSGTTHQKPTSNDESRIFVEKGDAAYEKDNYDEAIAHYNQALDLNRNNVDAYLGRGKACREKQKYDRALTDYNKAIALDPSNAQAYSGRGLVFALRGHYENKPEDHNKAIADCNKALQFNRSEVDAYIGRGIAHANKDDYAQAIADYNKAIQLNPIYAYPYHYRGNTYYYKDDYDQAIADYDQAIQLNSKDPDFYHNRGIAHEMKANYDQAISDYKKVLALNNNQEATRLARRSLKRLQKRGLGSSLKRWFFGDDS